MANLRATSNTSFIQDRRTSPQQAVAGIPRRVQQSTFAMQLGITRPESTSIGTVTTTNVPLDSSFTSSFDYQAYLARARQSDRVQTRPQFRSKVVCILSCKHCEVELCRRGMKAILLADMNVELFSTDAPPFGVQLVNDDYQTQNCHCRIRDVACCGCGNVVGYHVTQPCESCMDACNNGHFWMFHCNEVNHCERQNPFSNIALTVASNSLMWANIPRAEKDTIPKQDQFLR